MANYEAFIKVCTPEHLKLLTEALTARAEQYTASGRTQAIAGGKEWRLRAVGALNMAQALFTLVEELELTMKIQLAEDASTSISDNVRTFTKRTP